MTANVSSQQKCMMRQHLADVPMLHDYRLRCAKLCFFGTPSGEHICVVYELLLRCKRR